MQKNSYTTWLTECLQACKNTKQALHYSTAKKPATYKYRINNNVLLYNTRISNYALRKQMDEIPSMCFRNIALAPSLLGGCSRARQWSAGCPTFQLQFAIKSSIARIYYHIYYLSLQNDDTQTPSGNPSVKLATQRLPAGIYRV